MQAAIVVHHNETLEKPWKVTNVALLGQTPMSSADEEEEETEKQCIIYFKNPKSGEQFAWDLPTQSIINNCTSSKEKFTQEYAPTEAIADKDYLAPWMSMRVGQEITLTLHKKISNREAYTTIDFVTNEQFTIIYDGEDLSTSTTVSITCNATSDTPTQLHIKADQELAGAINIFHPEPKEVNIRWIGVEINARDKVSIEGKVNIDKLKDYFNQSLSPVLIDVSFDNEEIEKFDITSYTPQHNLSKSYYQNVQDSLIGNHDRIATSDEAKHQFLNNLSKLYVFREGEERRNTNFRQTILLFLTHLFCFSSQENEETITKTIINGVSSTGEGLSLMFLKNEENETEVEIPHEIMHAIGLPHTFVDHHSDRIPQAHTFAQQKTNNYMDYDNDKQGLFSYQWKELHQSKYIK